MLRFARLTPTYLAEIREGIWSFPQFLEQSVGADLRVCPNAGEHTGSPLLAIPLVL